MANSGWICKGTLTGSPTAPICTATDAVNNGTWAPREIPQWSGPTGAEPSWGYLGTLHSTLNSQISALQSQVTTLQSQVATLESSGGGGSGSSSPFDPSTLDPAALSGAFGAGFMVVAMFWAVTYGVRLLLQFIKST